MIKNNRIEQDRIEQKIIIENNRIEQDGIEHDKKQMSG